MINDKLKEEFDKIAKETRESDLAQKYAPILKDLRAAVQELQDGGFNVTLELRPAGYGFSRPLESAPYFNGTVTIDGLPLDFAAFQNARYDQYQTLAVFMGPAPLEDVWYRKDSQNQDRLRKMLLGVKAKNDFLSESNIGAGFSRNLPGKPAAPKLNT